MPLTLCLARRRRHRDNVVCNVSRFIYSLHAWCYEKVMNIAQHVQISVLSTLLGEVVFQLRAYIYQARGLIGSDNSGLSDPFARVIFWNRCKQTRVVEATLSPKWDEALIFEKITLYGDANTIAMGAPIIIEFFDYDTVVNDNRIISCLH